MYLNYLLKMLCSLPIILIILYFIPFLGICLIIFRQFIYSSRKKFSTSIVLIIVGILILIPQIVTSIGDIFKISIPYLNQIIVSDIYIKLIKYSKLLLCIGIIFFMISSIVKNLFTKLGNFIKSYIITQEKRNLEIARKNDLEIKLRREKAKNTHVVYCPYCGADNMLTEKIGKCKYCRRQIQQ